MSVVSVRTTYLRDTKEKVLKATRDLERQYFRARWLAKNDSALSMRNHYNQRADRIFMMIRKEREKLNRML
jgi:hypothetical protein